MLDIIINPATGSGRGNKIFERLRPMFDSTGTKYKLHYSSPEHGIQDIVHEITSSRPANIIIIGGDGSMNEAINGIADFENTRLGFIPAGSGNDLAKALGIPKASGRVSPQTSKSLQEIISRMSRCETVRSIDIGISETEISETDSKTTNLGTYADASATRRLFNISSGIGFDAETCYLANRSKFKSLLNKLGLGKLIYIFVALRLIIKNQKFSCEIKTSDGATRTYNECLFAVGMNHKYEGGGFMFCPDATNSDGQLDFCIVNGVTPLKFLRMFPTAISGNHVKYKEIDIFRAKSAIIKTERPQYTHADGESNATHQTLHLAIHNQKLQLLF